VGFFFRLTTSIHAKLCKEIKDRVNKCKWFGFTTEWFPSGSHDGTPRTFRMCGLYQKASRLGRDIAKYSSLSRIIDDPDR
jgi:hypothetical protein